MTAACHQLLARLFDRMWNSPCIQKDDMKRLVKQDHCRDRQPSIALKFLRALLKKLGTQILVFFAEKIGPGSSPQEQR